MANVLDRILVQKRLDIAAAQERVSLAELKTLAASAPPVRDFVQAIRQKHPSGLIAEVKKASPSAGLIRDVFVPVEIATTYEANGAACISVLTDEHFFQGHLDFLRDIRKAVSIPVLRKDFIIDPYQVWEARAAGADCILLIAECLDDNDLQSLYSLALDLGMSALVEVYDEPNVERVLRLNPPFMGVNNRDLRSFKTDLQHVVRLRQQIPEAVLVVGESGIYTNDDVRMLEASGVHAILVGESLMRAADIGARVRDLLGTSA